MKKLLTLLLALSLTAGTAAFSEKAPVQSISMPATSEASKDADEATLPGPEELTEIAEDDAGEEAAKEVAEKIEEEPSEEPGEEPTEAPKATTTEGTEATPTEEPEPTPLPENAADSFVLWFEEGFGLSLPEGWVSYQVSAEDSAAGMRYALGDATGNRYLYVNLTPTDLKDMDALTEAVDFSEDYTRTGSLTFGGQSFVTFINSLGNASCAATLWGGDLLVFAFTPQSDLDYMMDASRIMETFTKP